MKKGKRVLLWVLALAVLAIGAVCIYLYPTWKAAGILQEKMEAVHFSYEIKIKLDKGELSEGQVRMFQILAELLGVEEEEMYSFAARGSVWEDRAYALVYLEGAGEPLVEFYAGDEGIALNEAMLYNTIRDCLVEKYGILGRLIPEQEGNLYISLEQVEQMFGVKFRKICEFAFPSVEAGLTRHQYFLMLAAMSREALEDGNRFGLTTDQTKVRFDVSGAGGTSAVTMYLDMRNPAETFSEMALLLSGMEIRLPVEQLRVLENFTMTVKAGESMEITMPTEYVNQNTVDLIAEIRVLIEKILGRQIGPKGTVEKEEEDADDVW